MDIHDLINRIHSEGLAFNFGTSPYEAGTPPHTVFAHVAGSYANLHVGRLAKGIGFAPVGFELEALEKAYAEYQSLKADHNV